MFKHNHIICLNRAELEPCDTSTLRVKFVTVTAFDIPSCCKQLLLGSVSFAESFVDSAVRVKHDGEFLL